MKKMYKILQVIDNKVYSPFQGFNYGELEEIIGKEFVCNNFDESYDECSSGFYATRVRGLIYSLNMSKNNRVFEVEMSGKEKRFNEYKHRFEKQTIIRMLEEEEVKQLIKEQSDKMDWDYYRACYPTNPLKIEVREVDDNVIGLLKEVKRLENYARDSVLESVGDFILDIIWNSAWDSVWDSVLHSTIDSGWRFVRCSVEHSVWASAYAQIGSCFPNIKKWKGVEPKNGEYPFQCYIDLHNLGFVPTFYNGMWRLHAGTNAKVVFEVEDSEL